MLRQKLFKDFLKNKELLHEINKPKAQLKEEKAAHVATKERLEEEKNYLAIRDQLIEIHFALVHKIVKDFKYFPKSLQREDLYQEGILGLIKALDNYEDLGYDFIAYATPTIKREITKLIRGLQTTSISKGVFEKEKQTRQTSNIPLEEWEEATQPRWSTILNPHQLWLKQYNHELFLKNLKNILNPQEFEIIRLSFGITLGNVNEEPQIEYSNKNIGQILNLSSRQVAIIKNQAITKLQKIYKERNK
ncbi:sigma-70 family RNA polymerase sigma factor [Candidatus Phytoplasma australiense]|uniref:DNA-Directed RNA Polymerase Sigma Subunit n=1 Tax=Strawberry lethal yellows phytoplasma (CPA) str. NZSb11 TaxID=980422 RepID=R4S165_PHYAS|nr:sigma-70 family RNA polymerase sigma factor [Candidatus Phytoplasma australiense]AGL90084.1 DNA-Directed RNA Polymerase Sigma Subunit [Strawberry lethal yellows phytoplasma (CPA) str. NZSb11]AGL90488.1 DNA-Directed RNA Polymerase Sigma Subunit [Strawberry lethal yellows phytoplasma (CPA) str. NZSb11]